MKVSRLASVSLLGILLITGVACGPKVWQLCTVVPQGQGTISPSSGTFTDGDIITLTADPASGYIFSHWEGHANGSQNPATITMDSDKVVYAYFTETGTIPMVNVTTPGNDLLSPILLAPANGAVFLTKKPIFKWSPICWADKYDIQVSTDAGFASASLVIDQNLSNVQDYQAPSELHYNTYYWHVKAKSDILQTAWSSTDTFMVSMPPPSD